MGALVWLASYPKSGNTWLRSFLHNVLRNPAESYDINRMSDFTLGESQTRWFQLFDPRPPSEYSVDDVRRLRPVVQRHLTTIYPDSVFVKTHNALVTEEGLPLILQEATAGAIYVVRDPRDVAISYSHHLGISIDDAIKLLGSEEAWTPGNATNVHERLTSWSNHVKSWTQVESPRLYIVRYEDMLDSPIKTFSGIAGFLGLQPPRQRLEKAIKLSSFKVLKEQEKRHGFIEKSSHADAFFRKGEAGQWKKTLTAMQLEQIQADHVEQMRRFGYLQ